MKTYRYNLLNVLVISTCILGGSCSQYAGNRDVLVNCILSQDTVQILHLASCAADELSSRVLQEATIFLFDETSSVDVGHFFYEEDNRWSLPYSAIPRHKYRIEIRIPERKPIKAYTTMPGEIVPKMSVGFISEYTTASLPNDVVWIMGMDYAPESEEYFVVDKIASNLVNVDNFNTTGEFFHQALYFPSSAVNRFVYVEDKPLHKRYIRVPSVEEGGERVVDGYELYANNERTISIAGSFTDHCLYDFLFPSYVLYMAVSQEYDLYLKSCIDNGAPFSYSNIQNGTGIFGAKTEQKQYWTNKLISY